MGVFLVYAGLATAVLAAVIGSTAVMMLTVALLLGGWWLADPW